MIEAKKVEGYVSDSDGKVTVVMNTTLTPELIEEGYVREVISKVQTMRKDADFEVMDHITLALCGNDKIAEICKRNEAFIKKTVLADEVVYLAGGETCDGAVSKDWNLNGEDVTISVKRK